MPEGKFLPESSTVDQKGAAPARGETETSETENVTVRSVQPEDYEKIEQLIQRCILEVNAKDYSPAVIQRMLSTDPYQPKNKKDEREYFVAGDKGLQGVIGLVGNEIKTFFVEPAYQGKGVGRTLLAHVEEIIRMRGYSFAQLYAAISAKTFYEKNGYVVLREDVSDVDQEQMLRYYMEKIFLES